MTMKSGGQNPLSNKRWGAGGGTGRRPRVGPFKLLFPRAPNNQPTVPGGGGRFGREKSLFQFQQS